MSPWRLPVSSPAVVMLHLFCGLVPSISWLLAMSRSALRGVRRSWVRPRAASHIKARFIPRGLLVGFPADTIVPHNQSPPWKGPRAAPRRGFRAELGEGGSGPAGGGEHIGARQKGPAPNLPGSWAQSCQQCPSAHPPNGASEEGLRLGMLTLGLNLYTHLFKQMH